MAFVEALDRKRAEEVIKKETSKLTAIRKTMILVTAGSITKLLKRGIEREIAEDLGQNVGGWKIFFMNSWK
jgi:ribosomal silencing factor RsfS